MKFRLVLLLAACTLLTPLVTANRAEAIPAFTRLYKTECSTCHTIFPERNEFGDAFEKNGYIWPGKLPAQAQAKTNLDPVQKREAEALFNSGLPEILPISVMVQHNIGANADKTPDTDLDKRSSGEMFAGGNLRKLVGYWVEYGFGDDGVGEVFAQFQKPAGLPFNVKVGKFKSKLSLWKANDRPSLSGFGENSMRIGSNPFRLTSRQGAVELNSVIAKRLFVAAGIGDGLDKAQDDSKDYYGHISVRIGGTDFLGNEPEVDLDHDSIWDFLTLTVGGFGYAGSVDEGSLEKNDFVRAGLEEETLYKRFKMRLSAIYGKDEHPDGIGDAAEARFYMAQAEYLIGSNLMPSFRYEYQDIDGEGITKRYVPCISYTMLQNLRLAVEHVYTETPDDYTNETTFNIAFAF